MKCPFCGFNDTRVIDSRPFNGASVVRRRRECPECMRRFSTYERMEEVPQMVVKSDNRREPFSRDKLREGILKACEKRPITSEAIEKLVSEIEYEIQDYVMEVPSKLIGEKVLEKLLILDPVAYIRFASVYRQFKDIDTFIRELDELKNKFKAHQKNNKDESYFNSKLEKDGKQEK